MRTFRFQYRHVVFETDIEEIEAETEDEARSEFDEVVSHLEEVELEMVQDCGPVIDPNQLVIPGAFNQANTTRGTDEG